jgi:GPH family glycoside/pentoside/hexuronide:cation symporter
MDERVKLREKIAYGMSDFASCLSWGLVGSFMMYYYTDIALIPAAAIGTMFLLCRIWDAINDPIMGVIIDRTHSKWGKSRPWFLWGALPLSVVMVLAFSIPDISSAGKLIWAYVTFVLLDMTYTAVNVPVSSILPAMTLDPHERNVLGVFRVFGALSGNVLVGMTTLGFVAFFGSGRRGWTLTMTVYAVLSLLMFLFVFASVKERVAAEAQPQQKALFHEGVKDGLKAMKGNIPWFIATGMGLLMNLMQAMRGAGLVYYLTYNLGQPGLVPLITFLAMTVIIPLLVLPFVVKHLGKKKTIIIGNCVSVAGYGLVALSGASVPLLIIGTLIGSVGGGLGIGLVFILIADSVDYGAWISGVRAEGFLSAMCSFGQRIGTGIGGAAGAWILAAGHYVANAEQQAASALTAIHFNFAVTPVIVAVLNIVLILFWNLDKLAPRMIEDLKAGRIRGQAAN